MEKKKADEKQIDGTRGSLMPLAITRHLEDVCERGWLNT